ncbi:MAG: hypothetical protein HDT28_09505 [Clostridiales bacterium]|nr:hypothetical protein [Clostridiales bacterium]
MTRRLQKAIISVQNVISVAKSEMANENSKWDKGVIEQVVLPEMQELYDHFIVGERYFKYKRKFGISRIWQRRLQSVAYMLDTLEKLSDTELGQAIYDFQRIYDRL